MKVFQGNDKSGFDVFTLTPMSTGDIIDRAARLYRREAPDLLRIVLLPSLTSYGGMVLVSIGYDGLRLARGETRFVMAILLMVTGATLFLVGKAAFYAMLGGAARAVFNHISGHLDGQIPSQILSQILRQMPEQPNGSNSTANWYGERPFAVRPIYGAVRQRFRPLIGATILLLLTGIFIAVMLYVGVSLLVLAYVTLHLQLFSRIPIQVQVVLATLFGLVVVGGMVWIALQFYGRIIYVPQIMMVEERGITGSLSRSFSLARGQARQIGTLLLFWFYVAWSLWVLLIMPLGWYGYLAGFDANPFNIFDLDGPLWYRIARQTLTQLSEILVAPIAVLGFTLLYIDTRIRREGLDVELLAGRMLSQADQPSPDHPGGREAR